jgi:hypothetical protein
VLHFLLPPLPKQITGFDSYNYPVVICSTDIIHYAYYRASEPGMETKTGIIRKLTRVEMSLHHVLYISYLVPELRVRQLVPEELPLAVVGRDKVFVSVVILQSSKVRLSSIPFPRFRYNQVNIRTYVLDPYSRQQAVFFIRSGVTSSVISLLTRSVGIPWQHISTELETSADSKGEYLSYKVDGVWDQPFSLVAEEEPDFPSRISPFEDVNIAINYLVRPLIGFFGQKGKARSFRIWHSDVRPRGGLLKHIDFPLLKPLDLLDETAISKPDSVLIVPNAYFYIYMPPERIKMK